MFNYQHWGSALFILFAFTLNLALFLLPGFAGAMILGSRREGAPVYQVMLIIATSAALGYASIWIFFANRPAGKAFTFLIYGLALFSITRNVLRPGLNRRIVAPFLFVLLAGICYLSLFYLFGDPKHHKAGLAGARFFEEGQPGDNIIPLLFAERIYNHEPPRPFCCGDWLSSDRPPLQAGIFLLEQPLRLMGVGTHYQLLATALQCLWVCGVWCLLTVLGASERRIRQVMVILVCSGFSFYNSVYAWPKLLAAACMLFVFSIALDIIRAHRPATGFQVGLATLCLSLALMAHPGSSFSLPVLGLAFLRDWHLFSLRQTGLALSIMLAFYLPWSAYQNLVDPPGNRLLKMHLAGVYSPDSRSTWRTIADAYGGHSWREIANFKLSNAVTLLGDNPLAVFVPKTFHRSAIVSSRRAQREWIWNDVGPLNAGWLGAIWLLFERRKRAPAVPCCGWLLAASIFNLIVWSMALFGPNVARIAHSSYADVILLGIGLCGCLLALPAAFALVVFALELWNLLVVWALFPPLASFPPGTALEMPFLLFGILALGILIWIFARACFRCDPSEQGCTLP